MKPRTYQVEAKRACYRALKSCRSALVDMPTGTGKTVTFASIIADAVAAGRRVLVLAHREELLDQAADKISRLAGVEVAIEQGQRKEDDGGAPVVVACVFSLIRRLDRFGPGSFDLIIVDEAHRTLAKTYRDLLAHFEPTKYMGFTATPNRGDERALGQVYDRVAYSMTPADAAMGGWLVPFRTVTKTLRSLDLSKVRRRSGDMAAGELGAAMSEMAVLREAIVPAVDEAGDKQAIVFCVTVAHMHLVAETVRAVAEERRLDLVVDTVDGTTPKDDRRRIMDDFRAKRVNWLVNVEVATEGFDAPAVEAVVLLRPTESRALYTQMRGRGGRPLPGVIDGVTADSMREVAESFEASTPWLASAVSGTLRGDDGAARRLAISASGKPECLVLDFTDASGKFALAREMDLLGGDYDLPEQREAEAMLARGDARNLLEALELARAKRRAELRERRARAGDPFALFCLDPRKDPYGRKPTAKHRRLIASMRIPNAALDWREANVLAVEMARRDRLDLCLYSQASLLARAGHPLDEIHEMPRRVASEIVRSMAVDGWRKKRAPAG